MPHASHRFALAALLAGAALCLGFAQDSAKKPGSRLDPSVISEFGGRKSATKGHLDATMGFAAPTQVAEVLVHGGQECPKGTLLIRGDDAEDLSVLKLQKAKAESDWPVQRARKQADLAELEYRRLEKVQHDGGSSTQEVERAKLTWETAVIDWESAKVNQTQEVIQVDRLQARLDKLHLVAPFDCVVDEVKVNMGHAVTENEKVIRVVSIDPLITDVPAPTEDPVTLTLKQGDKAWILLDIATAPRVIEGKVIEVAPTTDLGSLTRRVRVEIPNPKGPNRILAGEPAYVRFTQPPQSIMAKVVAAAAAQQLNTQAAK